MVGFSADVGVKLGYTAALVLVLFALRWLVHRAVNGLLQGKRESLRFWTRQAVNVATAVVFIAVLLSIWFDNPSRLVTGLGLFSAGVAFALQQVITSIAGYLLILRGDVFSIGDRIVMGGVRGDVIGLGFIRTTILEMGKPGAGPDDTGTDSWVRARQYTGRIVTVANSTVFSDPVYNYTRDFPFLWDELVIPVPYDADRDRAEQILLDAARRHGVDFAAVGSDVLDRMRRRYFMPTTDFEPTVFYGLTDNWLELTIRFVAPAHGIRKVKSDMSREILAAFDDAGIQIASATYDIVGFPPIRVEHAPEPYPPEQAARAPSEQ